MMAFQGVLEREALDELDRRLSGQGYRLIRQPKAADLPAFLSRLRPDAVAVGKAPNLLIEVLTGRGAPRAESAKVEQLRDLLVDHPDWRLEIVYANSTALSPPQMSSESIRRRIDQIRQLAQTDGAAALLLAWSTLEAVARALEPDLASRSLTPSSIIELLIGQGYLLQSEAKDLRQSGQVRNAVAHGQIDYDVPSTVTTRLLEVVSRMVDVLDRR